MQWELDHVNKYYVTWFLTLLPTLSYQQLVVFAGAIMVEATLSFLGLSVQEPTPTWGRLLNLARSSTIMKDQWWLWVFPGILLVTLIIGVNLIGEGLRDAVDPKI